VNLSFNFWQRGRRLAALCLLAASAASCRNAATAIGTASKDGVIPVAARTVAPDFSLTDVSGKQITLSSYKGRVVLLDFWAVDCGGCKIEVPWYVEFDGKYRDKGLSLIGLDMYGESPSKIKPFMAQAHMEYPVAVGTDALGEKFGLTAMPLTLLIDRGGRIAVSHAGIVDKAAFERDIQLLLQQ
jgi:cytochrome c biogenesis protein CcmG/thiol:disulfide interchange protein DsbE